MKATSTLAQLKDETNSLKNSNLKYRAESKRTYKRFFYFSQADRRKKQDPIVGQFNFAFILFRLVSGSLYVGSDQISCGFLSTRFSS